MKLIFFGRLRDSVSAEPIEYSPVATVVDTESLRGALAAEYPALLDCGIRIAVDDVLATGPVPIGGAREIAFLPPVSGG